LTDYEDDITPHHTLASQSLAEHRAYNDSSVRWTQVRLPAPFTDLAGEELQDKGHGGKQCIGGCICVSPKAFVVLQYYML
ncbi:hypothetical protein KCU85_g160, partial [Aureobasidium melanogenum]